MPTFLFRASNAKTDDPIKVHITLGGVERGFTPDRQNEFLEVTVNQKGSYSWSARRNGTTVRQGDSSGGEIHIAL
jgi:hypothetical protein